MATDSNEPANFRLSASYRPRTAALAEAEDNPPEPEEPEEDPYIPSVAIVSDGDSNLYMLMALTGVVIIILGTLVTVYCCRVRKDIKLEK